MRNLFLSENRTISKLIYSEWEKHYNEFIVVHGESLEPVNENNKKRFNVDFSLDFLGKDKELPEKRKAIMWPILPQTIGAEIFLIVEAESFKPIWMQLMGGGAFSCKYFTHYIEEIETAIQIAISTYKSWLPYKEQFSESDSCEELSSDQLSKRRPLKKHKYFRIMVIYDDICFLSFPRHELPTHQGTRYRIAEADDRCIDCCVDDEGVVCFDGWLKTSILPPPKGKVRCTCPRLLKACGCPGVLTDAKNAEMEPTSGSF